MNELQRLAKKVERIMKEPAPFILDDGCCFLLPCCVCVPHYHFTRRSSEQFLADFDEVSLSVDGHIMVDPGNHLYQSPMSLSPRSEEQLAPSTYSTVNHDRKITTGPEQLVVSFPPLQNSTQEPSFCPGDQLSVCPLTPAHIQL